MQLPEIDEVDTTRPRGPRARAYRIAAFAAFRGYDGELGADRDRRDVGAVGRGAFGEIVRQLGVPCPGLFGNRALGFHPLFNGSSGVIARVRLHDPGPRCAAPVHTKTRFHRAAAEGTLLTKGFIIRYYPQAEAQTVPPRHRRCRNRDTKRD